MKTRAKGPVKSAEAAQSADTTQKTTLSTESSNPPQLFILPETLSKEARIITLENPRYRTDTRYVVCPQRGFYEFSRIAAPKTTPRSWLLSQDSTSIADDTRGDEDNTSLSKGYVAKAANLFIATPIDPLFLVLPALAPPKNSKGSEEKKLFLSGEDYLERIADSSSQFNNFLSIQTIRASLERRMASVCDTVDAGDEMMYRISEEKLLEELLLKAKRMCERGLPASMEEELIRKALEAPMLSIKRGDSSIDELVKEEDVAAADSGISTPLTESADSQSTEASTITSTSSFSEVSTVASSFSGETAPELKEFKPALPTITAPDAVADLLRLRTAFSFLCSNYIAPHLSAILTKLLASSSSIDFTPLDTHLTHLTKLRQEALAARSLGDFSRKRAMEADDEDVETRAEKKRKKEEEEKRKKAGESRGVKNLKKVNVTGMKKMSDFFKKK